MIQMNADFAQMLVFAGLGDWLQFLIPAIFVVFWVISQISGGKDQARKLPNQRGGARPLAPNDGSIRGEIDDFLRRVKEQAGIPDETVDENDWDEEPEFARSKPAPVQQAQVMEAEVIQPPMSAGLPSSIASSDVARAGDRFVRQVQSLGANVGSAHENMDLHTHEVFDHAVGELNETSGGPQGPDASDRPATVPTAAADIRRMLSGPEGGRKAIVISEILNRPTDRW